MSYLKGKLFYDDGTVVISGTIDEMRHFTTTPHYCKCTFTGTADDIVFQDVMFVDCTFDGWAVTNSTFNNCKFIDCDFLGMTVSNTQTSNCVFSKCSFECIEGPFVGNVIDDCYIKSSKYRVSERIAAVHKTENYTIFETMGCVYHASKFGNTVDVLWDFGISDERTTFMARNQIRGYLLPAFYANVGKLVVSIPCPASNIGRQAALDCIPKIAPNTIYRTDGNAPVDLTESDVAMNKMLPCKLEFWLASAYELAACVYVKGD